MATIIISRPSSPARDAAASQSTGFLVTTGSDYLRGGGARDVIARPLTNTEQVVFNHLVAGGTSQNDAYDLIFLDQVGSALSAAQLAALPLPPVQRTIVTQLTSLGRPAPEVYSLVLSEQITRPLTSTERQLFPLTFNPAVAAANGFPVATDTLSALAVLNSFGAPPFATGTPPSNALFGGDDIIYGRGGNDYIADLSGNNLVSTDEGDDRILLGEGNDRVFDRGGNNVITDLGGNNLITLRGGGGTLDPNNLTGNDIVTTGAGNDNINAGDGRNTIDAGDGNNIVRGGDGLDIIDVGVGNDFVEVQAGRLGQTIALDLPFIGVFGFEAHNFVQDAGGDDTIRATGSSRNDLPGRPDQVFNGDDVVLSDIAGVVGDDRIELGGGNNIVVDIGGNNIVNTLEGNDIIFTSFLFAGNDTISAGAGDDIINPGDGVDRVRGGPGSDDIDLGSDGFADTLVYAAADVVPAPTTGAQLVATTDAVLGFEVGRDRIDMTAFTVANNGFDLSYANYVPVNVGRNAVAFDVDLNGTIDFYTTIFFDLGPGRLPQSSFVFDAGLV